MRAIGTLASSLYPSCLIYLRTYPINSVLSTSGSATHTPCQPPPPPKKQTKEERTAKDAAPELDDDDPVLGRAGRVHVWAEGRAEAQADRVAHGGGRVDERHAVAGAREGEDEEVRGGVGLRADEDEPGGLELVVDG